MSAESQETPRPTVNTRRPNLQERAARRNKKPSGGFLGFVGLLFRAVTLVAIVLGGVYLYQHVLTKPAGPARPADAGAPGPPNEAGHGPAKAAPTPTKSDTEDLDARRRRMELETAQGVQRQRLASAKLKQRQAIALGESVGQVLGGWQAELEQWSKEVAPLPGGDRGKALAANKPLLRQYRAVIARERPGRDEAGRLKAQVEGLVAVMKAASENPDDASLPGPEITEGLQGLLREAKSGRDKNREARELVASLVTQAADEGSRGEMTLADAARKQQDEEHLASAAVIEAARSKAAEEGTKATAKAAEEAARARALALAEQIRDVGAKQEALIRAETQTLTATKERERIRRLAEDPAIRARFAPLLAKGIYLFDYGGQSERPVPVSFGDLSRKGYLKDAETFARAMSGAALTDFGFRSDRPRFPKPRNDAEWKRVEQDLAMFKELGPTWVEMGKLLP